MSKELVAMDIDDVLSMTAKGFTDFSNKKWGTVLAEHDFQENLEDMWGIDRISAQTRLESGEFFTAACNAVQELARSEGVF